MFEHVAIVDNGTAGAAAAAIRYVGEITVAGEVHDGRIRR
jgi:hypothetical protein